MIDLRKHYDEMWGVSAEKILASDYTLDPLIDSPDDRRFGIMLIARPEKQVLNSLSSLIMRVRSLEPDQYYYPFEDLHFTIMSIISCYDGFTLDQVNINCYRDKIQEALHDVQPFHIECKGLTAFPGGVLMQGFVYDETLQSIRENLRRIFGTSTLQHSIDSRYKIHTAHSTVVRFRQSLRSPIALIESLQQDRDTAWGTVTVKEIDFVFSDWYQRRRNTKLLHRFPLGR